MRKITIAALLTLCAVSLCHAQTPPCGGVLTGTASVTKLQSPTFVTPTFVTDSGTITISNSDFCSVTLESADFTDGKLTLIKHSVCFGMTRRVWKEIYVAHDGEIVLERKIEATILPAQGERVEWPKQ